MIDNDKNLRWIRNSLLFISFALFIVCLKTLKGIFIPLFFAVYLSFLFAPIIRFLYSKKVPSVLVITIVTIIVLATFSLFGFFMYSGLANIISKVPKYESRIMEIGTWASLNFGIPQADVSNFIHPKISYLKFLNRGSMDNVIRNIMRSTLDYSLYVILMIFFMIFIVADRNRFSERVYQLISGHDRDTTHKMLFKVETQVIRYIVNKTLINIGQSSIVVFWLYLFRIEFPLLCGFLTLILLTIPTAGTAMSVILPVLIAILQYGFSWHVFAILGALTITHILIGNLAEPKILGDSLNLSPIMIIVSLVFWAWIWGPLGMILAIPITSSLNIILREFQTTKSFSRILSDPNYVDD